MAVLALAVAIPLTLIVRSGGSDGGGGQSTTARDPAAGAGAAHDAALGVRYALPSAWNEHERHGELDLESPDGATGVTITAPAAAGQSAGVLNDAFAKLQAGAKSFDTVQSVRKERLGGLSGAGAAIEIVNGAGTTVRVSLSALNGRRRTYLVQAFSADPGTGAALTQAQAVLDSLRLTG
jgi:hypothetical protein